VFDGVGTTETLILVLVAAMIILPIWWIVSAYNRRVKEIEKLREDVEKLKKDQRRE
jgi:hypothetical protein